MWTESQSGRPWRPAPSLSTAGLRPPALGRVLGRVLGCHSSAASRPAGQLDCLPCVCPCRWRGEAARPAVSVPTWASVCEFPCGPVFRCLGRAPGVGLLGRVVSLSDCATLFQVAALFCRPVLPFTPSPLQAAFPAISPPTHLSGHQWPRCRAVTLGVPRLPCPASRTQPSRPPASPSACPGLRAGPPLCTCPCAIRGSAVPRISSTFLFPQ